VVSLARLVTLLASAVGVVASVGSGTAWLYSHVSSGIAYLAALLILAVAIAVSGFLAFRRLTGRYKLRHWWLYVAVQASGMLLTWAVVSSGSSQATTEYAMAYVFAGLAVLPVVWLSYQLDKANHKICPMCCERIKAGARICRYCASSITLAVTSTPRPGTRP
jgi:hypothetical protein